MESLHFIFDWDFRTIPDNMIRILEINKIFQEKLSRFRDNCILNATSYMQKVETLILKDSNRRIWGQVSIYLFELFLA